MVQTMVRPSAPGGGARVEISCMWSLICHIYAVPISLFRAATVTVVPGRRDTLASVISPDRRGHPRAASGISPDLRGYDTREDIPGSPKV